MGVCLNYMGTERNSVPRTRGLYIAQLEDIISKEIVIVEPKNTKNKRTLRYCKEKGICVFPRVSF